MAYTVVVPVADIGGNKITLGEVAYQFGNFGLKFEDGYTIRNKEVEGHVVRTPYILPLEAYELAERLLVPWIWVRKDKRGARIYGHKPNEAPAYLRHNRGRNAVLL